MDLILNKQSIFRLLLIALWISGQTGGSEVNQIPLLWQKQGENATIGCSHTKGASYFQMYWYRQLPGENMKLIVFTALGKKEHDFEGFSTKKFSATKPDAQRGTFSVLNLEAADNGLYFCAVSEHSASDTKQVDQTPPFIIKKTGQSVDRRTLDHRKERTTKDPLIMLKFTFLTFIVFLHPPVNDGASDQTFVFQTPPSIIKKPGESVDGEIHCSHNASDSDHLLWYKQDKHQAPKCLGYLNRNMPHPEEDVEDRINFAGESSDYSNLTISAVSVNDSAVYFCAVSQHSMEESA
ncbi:uncharacterized protein LOC108233918 [Kryptolebias marmoratus]|uniref:uncharacterized protein LOC108233918 n=1 Tax=Kryptolebias marmoratus TaxID=37003 RepID=UPI0018ACC7D7|nr:uncharacterized protein LOC108233918 [Kryptolebias marmoratus]